MNPDTFTFDVYGEPKALKRHRTRVIQAGNGKAFSKHYDPSENKSQKAMVKAAAIKAMRDHGLIDLYSTPLALSIDFRLLQPGSKRLTARGVERAKEATLYKKLFPAVKPDLDNLEKLVKDALNWVLWTDDALVCAVQKSKQYTTLRPYTRITVRKMNIGEAAVLDELRVTR